MDSGPLASKSRRIALASLFGVVIFLSKAGLPSPLDKALVVVQILLLVLSSLLMGTLGATYTAVIGGLLLAMWRAEFAPFTLGFSVLFGLFVDGSILMLKARPRMDDLNTGRILVASVASTAVTGLLSFYVTVYLFQLPIPSDITVSAPILVGGTISGLVGGWLAVFIWKRYIVHLISTESSQHREP